MIDYSYIAGFFDGEGSAMILTVKTKETIFRFRPTIKIAQKTTPILFEIKNKLGFGTVLSENRTPCYQINGNKNILKFIELVENFVIIKKRQLPLLKELISLQCKKNQPYTIEETQKMIEIRDKIHELNKITRSNLHQKYSKETILNDTKFYTKKEWKELRKTNGKKIIKICHEKYTNKIRKPRIEKDCKCGCNQKIITPDKKGREREFIHGHNQNGMHWKWGK